MNTTELEKEIARAQSRAISAYEADMAAINQCGPACRWTAHARKQAEETLLGLLLQRR